jgi:hypothetical protein
MLVAPSADVAQLAKRTGWVAAARDMVLDVTSVDRHEVFAAANATAKLSSARVVSDTIAVVAPSRHLPLGDRAVRFAHTGT